MSLRLTGSLAGLLLAAATPVAAHHSFAAEYDGSKPVKVSGVDEQGRVMNWGFSAGPPGVLQRRGISRNAMKIGDLVVVEGFRARDGSNNASGGRVTFSDGRSVFTASAEDKTPR
jgi:hypothetical protein